ncbi:MAG: molybdate ABC transporter substrate-binding protein [Lachnospiraceae bacterium]|nr:molybdate ABC transporter substrate-binding protein [Lachnospiraceae bacterium]
MKKRIFGLILVVCMLVSMVGCNKSDKKKSEKVELTILAAASLKDVTAKIKADYEKEHEDVTLTFSYGASGTLMNQIKEGAPCDVFMSAAKKQMNTLIEEGLVNKDDSKELLENKVVLIVPKGEKKISSFEDVKTKAGKIALGEESSVPVGQYAAEVFKNLNMYDEVKAKAVYGNDVKAVLSYVESGNVDCGVVYSTDALVSDKVEVVCSATMDMVSPVIYPVAVTKDSKHAKEAKEFMDYLSGDKASKYFEEYGFSMVK